MSVNRDPRVGDRFYWSAPDWPKRVTAIACGEVSYGDSSIDYLGAIPIEAWRRDATLYGPRPPANVPANVPAVGTEFKWNTNGRKWDDQLRKVRKVLYVDEANDVVVWKDTDNIVGTLPLRLWSRAQLPDSATPPEWPKTIDRIEVFGKHESICGLRTGHVTPPDSKAVYDVEPLPSGKVLLHPLREDGTRW